MAISTINQNGLNAPLTLTSPVLTTPNLGTPSAINLTNATALPASALPASGISASSITTGTLPKAQLPAGSVLQVVQVVKTDTFGTSSVTPSYADITGLSVSITPTSSSNKVLVILDMGVSNPNPYSAHLRLLRDGTAIYIGDASGSRPQTTMSIGVEAYNVIRMTGVYLDSPATTSAVTYKMQMGTSGSGTAYVGRSVNDRNTSAYDPRAPSGTITLMEIKV